MAKWSSFGILAILFIMFTVFFKLGMMDDDDRRLILAESPPGQMGWNYIDVSSFTTSISISTLGNSALQVKF